MKFYFYDVLNVSRGEGEKRNGRKGKNWQRWNIKKKRKKNKDLKATTVVF